jgi:hypothetical protein
LVEHTTAPRAASASVHETVVVPHKEAAQVHDSGLLPQGLGWQLATASRVVVV